MIIDQVQQEEQRWHQLWRFSFLVLVLCALIFLTHINKSALQAPAVVCFFSPVYFLTWIMRNFVLFLTILSRKSAVMYQSWGMLIFNLVWLAVYLLTASIVFYSAKEGWEIQAKTAWAFYFHRKENETSRQRNSRKFCSHSQNNDVSCMMVIFWRIKLLFIQGHFKDTFTVQQFFL